MRAAALALLVPSLALAQARSGRASLDPEPRYLAPLSYGVRLGGMIAYSSPAGAPSGVGGGAYALFDQQAILADVSADVFGGAHLFTMGAGLGVYFALSPGGDLTPYLGGGARLAWVKFGGEGAFGLQLHGALGLLVSRRWSPHVRLELAWFADTMGEGEKGGGPRHYSNGPMATLGLGF